jgi:flavin reductase (DIM6/NTAB) family NADH-FMN oxidoreductase RutF
MLLNYEEQNPKDIYHFMSQGVIPRPIAWIVTQGLDGVMNVAPFSYFIPLSSNPPSLIVSIGHKADGTPKDTLKNLRETNKCTVCMTSPELLEAMHKSSFSYPKEVGEVEELNLDTVKLNDEFPPIIKNVPTAFLCEFYKEVDIDGKTRPLLLTIKHHYIDDKNIIKEEGKIRIEYNPIARVGRSYATLREDLETPKFD